VVGRGKGDDIAFSGHRFGSKQSGGWTAVFAFRVVLCLIFLDGTEVVDEDEGCVKLWVDLAIGSSVSRAEVALSHVSMLQLG